MGRQNPDTYWYFKMSFANVHCWIKLQDNVLFMLFVILVLSRNLFFSWKTKAEIYHFEDFQKNLCWVFPSIFDHFFRVASFGVLLQPPPSFWSQGLSVSVPGFWGRPHGGSDGEQRRLAGPAEVFGFLAGLHSGCSQRPKNHLQFHHSIGPLELWTMWNAFPVITELSWRVAWFTPPPQACAPPSCMQIWFP